MVCRSVPVSVRLGSVLVWLLGKSCLSVMGWIWTLYQRTAAQQTMSRGGVAVERHQQLLLLMTGFFGSRMIVADSKQDWMIDRLKIFVKTSESWSSHSSSTRPVIPPGPGTFLGLAALSTHLTWSSTMRAWLVESGVGDGSVSAASISERAKKQLRSPANQASTSSDTRLLVS